MLYNALEYVGSMSPLKIIRFIAGIPTPLSYVPVVEESGLSNDMTLWERAYNFFLYVSMFYNFDLLILAPNYVSLQANSDNHYVFINKMLRRISAAFCWSRMCEIFR